MGGWARGRWWYQLAHVCQRWRNLIFGSSSYLNIFLVCTYRTPVADMLAHSPPLPLVIDYPDEHRDITAEDEEGTILALKQNDRVYRIRLRVSVPKLQKLILAIDEEYPILEYLIIEPAFEDNTVMMFPETLQAPHLRQLALINFALPIRSRLLTTAVGLVTLCLTMEPPSTYIHPNTLLQWLSFMPQLETLVIFFMFPVPNRDVVRQLTHTPIITPVTLPNLHWFKFRGVNTYLEAVVRRITAPRLEKLHIDFFSQLAFSVPRLQQFMNTTENLRFESATIEFSRRVHVNVYSPGTNLRTRLGTRTLSINVDCRHLDWQVASTAQISSSLNQMSSAVKHLTLEHEVHHLSSEEHNEVDHTEWRKILSSFSNVETLRIDYGLVEELSRFLESDDASGELLPELQELIYSGSSETGDAFASFINARQNVGRPVTPIYRRTRPLKRYLQPRF